jgi:hypothetical protein
MAKNPGLAVMPLETIANKIFILRGHRVMVDRDLAELFGVETKALNQATKRNQDRFPDDFMFQLTIEEAAKISSTLRTSSPSMAW